MSFYGLVMITTLLILTVYVGAFLVEMSNASVIANAYSIIAARIARSAGTSAPLIPSGGG
jgi:hypothetical protein